MGRATRHTPQFLGKKLELIRNQLGIKTYDEMVSRLNVKEVSLYRSTIYEYEKGKREPPLIVLLRYARLADLSVESLIDDEINLLDKFKLPK
jgi:transcriptional regulator with XRE-family HTH domain